MTTGEKRKSSLAVDKQKSFDVLAVAFQHSAGSSKNRLVSAQPKDKASINFLALPTGGPSGNFHVSRPSTGPILSHSLTAKVSSFEKNVPVAVCNPLKPPAVSTFPTDSSLKEEEDVVNHMKPSLLQSQMSKASGMLTSSSR